ncbi:hypothetical protein HPB48_010139 [Haemaphysalis longicornis]|uniref:Uncharacterized protein n=1 Tax=Haemaphysalis longicornis TaxID=44386 RepID=A0A9J6FT35_HAELO|nr:hypothetical protein HPB48_010139 [Haemaphysalis longicornis]
MAEAMLRLGGVGDAEKSVGRSRNESSASKLGPPMFPRDVTFLVFSSALGRAAGPFLRPRIGIDDRSCVFALLGFIPTPVETFMSPVQTDCVNVNYYIPEDEQSDHFSEQRWERMHMARSVVALFIISFFFAFLSFFTGIAGCWKRSNSNIIATGLLQILAALTVAGAMGLWHGVEYYDFKKLHDNMSVYSWPAILRRKGVTEFAYGWSYMLAWVGVGTSLLTGILFLASARCLRREKKADQAKNMQYLMPVYPDKRQPYGYAAYPGPYAYHHGQQYGPYGY